jgi:D-alanyl-lipoteichoic acid acyltransferase DltB (MBOAT superfamily)
MMFSAVHSASIANYDEMQSLIQPAWLLPSLSRGVDVSDTQFKDFISNIPLLGPALIVFTVGARLMRERLAPGNPVALQWYYIVTGVGFIIFLHGTTVLFMFALLGLNFFAAKHLSQCLPYATYQTINWSVHVVLLYVNYVNGGYSFSLLSPSLSWLDAAYPGRLRWHVIYNMSTLRMLAFNYDVWEMRSFPQERRDKIEANHLPTACVDCAVQSEHSPGGRCYKFRMEMPRSDGDYNLRAYLAYLCYIPLYVAGPMSSFNSFVSYTYEPTHLMSLRDGMKYAYHIVLTFVVLLLYLHFVYINAIIHTPGVFEVLTTSQKASLLFLTLSFLWMKFRFFWRFFRLLSIADGVEVPEDMPRCFANTTTVQNFWKDWHASFNIWIVRYMYIPLGGAKRRLMSVFPIFMFIAFWHDIELRLFGWALIMCVAFIPEILVTMYFSQPHWRSLPQSPSYVYLRAVGGAASITSLVVANIVGYGAGVSKTGHGAMEMMSSENLKLSLLGLVFFFAASVVSWHSRDKADEVRRKLMQHHGVKERIPRHLIPSQKI